MNYIQLPNTGFNPTRSPDITGISSNASCFTYCDSSANCAGFMYNLSWMSWSGGSENVCYMFDNSMMANLQSTSSNTNDVFITPMNI